MHIIQGTSRIVSFSWYSKTWASRLKAVVYSCNCPYPVRLACCCGWTKTINESFKRL